ncbi:DUF885 domain-containing protein [Sphingomonas endophytica]|uniref:Uncharacterized protein (DUF885 family) n=1 Tax=Sphingomonas endophytica TaxID=869719 RepID=A0ABR6N6R5_9SPHN|nr:DUF885 domain-containing protein [Sphingomonas endophytica]MBB5726473.1 uncharacterized protein (DUF885 family) [Sphingomonas endophytica]
MRALLLALAAPAAIAAQAPATSTAAEDARLTAFLDRAFDARVALSPEAQTSLGLKTNYDKLDDNTDAAAIRERDLSERQLREMRASFSPARLGSAGKLSYRLFEDQVERARDSFRFRKWRYPVSTNGSPMGEVPAFLINNHRVDTVADADAYVARIRDSERVMRETAALMREQAKMGIVPLKMTYAPVRADARKVLTGAPFTAGADSALMADFRKKVTALKASDADKQRLLAAAAAAMTGPMKRGYELMFTTLDALESQSTGNWGAWKLPQGAAYYAVRLRDSTTTNLTADQIHDLGLRQVAAIRKEMEAVKTRVGFNGTLEQFFEVVRTDPRFKYPNTEAGREAYLGDARSFVAQMMTAAPQWFERLPKAKLEVRAVEKWREGTASTAFYNRPAPDGSRPGIFYVNLVDMNQTQKIQLDAIAAHEAAPGHHFQIARAMELEGLPKFRAFGGYGAYVEGWGLYSERLAKEMGAYKDPYAEFGMLSNQVWRAIRLVVDTGVHSKRWTREQAVAYFRANSSVSDTDIAREVDRYFNWPGQATSYMVGQLKIAELRAKAERELGPKFDIRSFHEAVLGQGALPLDVLEEQVDAYIAAKKA